MRNVELFGLKPTVEWLNVKSYVLSPNDDVFRRDVFSYLLLKWAIKNEKRMKYILKNGMLKEIQRHDGLLKNKRFLYNYGESLRDSFAVGTIIKYLMSMYYYGHKERSKQINNDLRNVSMSKAGWLYAIVYYKRSACNKNTKKHVFSNKSIDTMVKKYVGGHHLCAAWNQLSRLKKMRTNDVFDNTVHKKVDLQTFYELSSMYYNFLYNDYASNADRNSSCFCDKSNSIVFRFGEGEGVGLKSWVELEKYPLKKIKGFIQGYNEDYDFFPNYIVREQVLNQIDKKIKKEEERPLT